MNRRRSHLDVLVCALLLATLVVQPAAGDSKGKGQGQGQGHGQAQGQGQGAAQAHAQAPGHGQGQDNRTAPAPAPPAAQPADVANAKQDAPAASARQARPAADAKQARSSATAKARAVAHARAKRAAAGKARSAQSPGNSADPGPPPAATTGPPEHAQDGGNGGGAGGPVDPVPGAAPPEERAAQTPPAAAPSAQDAGAPAAEENAGRRAAGSGATGARGGSDAGALAPAPTETPQAGAVTVPPALTPPAPDTQEPSGGAVPAPDSATGPRAPRSDIAGRGTATTLIAPQATGIDPASASAAGAPAVGSALEAALVTPATEAITRVRPAGPSASGGPRPTAGDSIDSLQGVADSGASDSSVGEVLVTWAKYALALLGLLVLALGVYTVLATARTRRLERQRERLMEDIGLLQAALLPAVPARLGALLTTVAYRPADGPAAGGDFYDAFALPDGRVGLLLGDVSGHGRQALAKTTLVRFTVRAHLEAGLSPREALAIAGRSLDGRLSDDFATVIAAIHDPVKGTLTYASAGHPPPIVVGPSRHRPVTTSSAPPIGAGFPTGQRQTVLPMPEGTSVMIFSDGLLEARVDGVALGPERLAEWLEELGPDATAKAVLDLVVTHADRVPDDLAAVLLHASPGATAPAARIEQLKLDVLDMDGPDLEGFLRGAGVGDVDRLIAGRHVSELLATASGVIVEVRTGEHPIVSVAPIGDESGLAPRLRERTR